MRYFSFIRPAFLAAPFVFSHLRVEGLIVFVLLVAMFMSVAPDFEVVPTIGTDIQVDAVVEGILKHDIPAVAARAPSGFLGASHADIPFT